MRWPWVRRSRHDRALNDITSLHFSEPMQLGIRVWDAYRSGLPYTRIEYRSVTQLGDEPYALAITVERLPV